MVLSSSSSWSSFSRAGRPGKQSKHNRRQRLFLFFRHLAVHAGHAVVDPPRMSSQSFITCGGSTICSCDKRRNTFWRYKRHMRPEKPMLRENGFAFCASRSPPLSSPVRPSTISRSLPSACTIWSRFPFARWFHRVVLNQFGFAGLPFCCCTVKVSFQELCGHQRRCRR